MFRTDNQARFHERTSAAESRISAKTKSARVELVPFPVELFSRLFRLEFGWIEIRMNREIWWMGRARLLVVPHRAVRYTRLQPLRSYAVFKKTLVRIFA